MTSCHHNFRFKCVSLQFNDITSKRNLQLLIHQLPDLFQKEEVQPSRQELPASLTLISTKRKKAHKQSKCIRSIKFSQLRITYHTDFSIN